MTLLCSSVNTEFTPLVGVFVVSIKGPRLVLERKSPNATFFAIVGAICGSADVMNNVAGCVYRLVPEITSQEATILSVDQ